MPEERISAREMCYDKGCNYGQFWTTLLVNDEAVLFPKSSEYRSFSPSLFSIYSWAMTRSTIEVAFFADYFLLKYGTPEP